MWFVCLRLTMVLSLYCKQRILFYYSQGICSSNGIKRHLEEEEKIVISRVAIWKFLKRYAKSQCLSRKEGSGRPSKITSEVKAVVERQMESDDETTAYQLHKLLTDRGYSLSITTILRCWKELGWTFRGEKFEGPDTSYSLIVLYLEHPHTIENTIISNVIVI